MEPHEIFDKPPAIQPCSKTENRPLWSVMIPAYNCADLLVETLESVLSQDMGADKMQIEVIDDASTDADVKAIVEKTGKGRVRYYRQPVNVGSLKNFQTCINRAEGYLVHLLHCDDKVLKGYYKKIQSLFEAYPNIGAAFCSFHYINEHNKFMWNHPKEATKEGILHDWLIRIAKRQSLQYCTITVKREVYETLGGFYGVTYGEDWEMWARIATRYEIAYTPELLAEYRIHTNSISSRSFLIAQNIKDIKWVIDTILKFLPEEKRAEVKKEAYSHYAFYATYVANNIWHQTHNKQATKLQIREALKMYNGLKMYYPIAKIYTKMLINRR
ncbi:MAG TPA: glycosyltransferase [Flavisolibacter sp.]|nr:glycosyltransferase [Flavisolibacter sp.]